MGNRPCVYCGAAWFGEAFPDPAHKLTCAMLTGLFPVLPADLADGGIICAGCDDPFMLGDFYVVHKGIVVCVGCGALDRQVKL